MALMNRIREKKLLPPLKVISNRKVISPVRADITVKAISLAREVINLVTSNVRVATSSVSRVVINPAINNVIRNPRQTVNKTLMPKAPM